MAHVFISYSKQDIAFARHLRTLLENESFDVWMDENELAPSAHWWPTIENNIISCSAFIVIMSPNSKASEWVEREILVAERQTPRKQIFPILLAGDPWSRLANIQYEDMTAGTEAVLPSDLAAELRKVTPFDSTPSAPPHSLEPALTSTSGRTRKQRSGPVLIAALVIGAVLFIAIGYKFATQSNGIVPRTAMPTISRNADWPRPRSQKFNDNLVEMVLVPPGCFMMGSSSGGDDEHPSTVKTCIFAPFWIDRYEVTNAQFASLKGVAVHDSRWTDANRPRESITWYDARDFCAKRGMRLPTEAEWEYAARGPDGRLYPWGDSFQGYYVRYYGNSRNETATIDSINLDGRAHGMAWVGAYDMSGNVWEWVNTIYKPYPYNEKDGRESSGNSDEPRVKRGGSWSSLEDNLRASKRHKESPSYRSDEVGFRCAYSE